MSEQNLHKKRTLRSVKKDKKSKKKKLRFQTKALRGKRKKIERRIREILCWILEIMLVCIVAYLLVGGFGQRVSNAGDSMKPVLRNGDVLLVNRVKYAMFEPKRGDIIAFKPGGNANSHYSVKRIVALPGDTIQINQGKVYINGKNIQKDIYGKVWFIASPGSRVGIVKN